MLDSGGGGSPSLSTQTAKYNCKLKLLMPADARQLRFVYQTLLAGKPGLCVRVCVCVTVVWLNKRDVWHVFPDER